MKKTIITIATIGIVVFSSCKKDDETTDPVIEPSVLVVPSTYEFTNSDGHSTVSFNGQAQRLEMLSEISSYMKEGNTAGNTVDAQVLKAMYANSAYTWIDGSSLGMTGSTKQLKSKTAAAPSGTADPSVQAYFESLMDEIGTLSSSTVSGENNGAPGQGGVVVSTTNPSKQYLQSAEGLEYVQLIEKGLMGAVFYNQIAMNYLGEDEMNSDNSVPSDPDNGKYYTEMEHAWDEAYGYFTTAIDYAPDGNGVDRFWGKYADGREGLLGTATSIAEAFRRGRAAISAGDIEIRDAQIEIIRHELEQVVAGTAIHYINGSIEDFSDDALRNHQLSEAVAFIGCLPYGHTPIADLQDVNSWINTIGENYYEVTTANLLQVRNQIASAAGLSDIAADL